MLLRGRWELRELRAAGRNAPALVHAGEPARRLRGRRLRRRRGPAAGRARAGQRGRRPLLLRPGAPPLAPPDRPARPCPGGGRIAGPSAADPTGDAPDLALDLLRTPEAGGRVVRGGLYRGVGFAISTALGLATAVLLLRYLGVDDFGRYATVTAVLGIVAGVTDAGLTAVGSREVSVARSAAERGQVMDSLLVLRLAAATIGVLVAIGFTVLAGYEGVVVAGTALGGIGIILISVQSLLTVPIWVELRVATLTALEVLRNLLTLAGVAALVVVGAGLLAFFGVQVLVGRRAHPVTIAPRSPQRATSRAARTARRSRGSCARRSRSPSRSP